jgi:SAM-dependent methyltransferase
MPPAWLAHPLTRGMDIDSPRTTALRRSIILEKPFLRKIYDEWYRLIAAKVPDGPGAILELGSGAGFFREHVPQAVTSDIFPIQGVDRVIDAADLPFKDGTLKAVVMTNVFHHLPQPRSFLDEAVRCLRTGGRIVLVEPWNTIWSRFIYQRLHHEPFDPHSREWEFESNGPLSDANGALPWIVFRRDATSLANEYPILHVVSIREIMPIRYLLSGGVSLRNLMPGWSFGLWKAAEWCLSPLRRHLGMFAIITLEKE